MHTVWKGFVSFGLVNIPIRLHAATENKDIKLRTLHKECNAPIQYEKVCSNCNQPVSPENIVRAYEYAKDKFVVLDDDELEQLKKEQEDKSVDIIDFVKLEEIDPIYFEKSYYLSPSEGGAKAYSLLRQALENSGKIGVAKITIRNKENLAVIRTHKNVLVMETIFFPDEIRATEDIPSIPLEQKLTKKELDIAEKLIEQLSIPFEPDKYQDEYRLALYDLIQSKMEKEKAVSPNEKSNVVDLMEALKKSIEVTKPQPKKRTTTRKRA